MAIEYICSNKEDNIVEVIESCDYFNNFLTAVYNKSKYSWYFKYTYHEFIYDLCNADFDFYSVVDDIILDYPLIFKFYVDKRCINLTLCEFIKDDLPLIHMGYLDRLVRKEKLEAILKL